MGKSSGSAPESDPQIGQAALENAQLGRDWLNESKSQFAQLQQRQAGIDALTSDVTNQQLSAARQAQGWASEDRSRYTNTFQPIQNAFIQRATNWDSPERQAFVAQEAKADVMNAAAEGQQMRARQSAAMGIDPTSGRYAGVERSADMGTALASAGAQNNARSQVRAQGMSLLGDAANMGSGLAVNPATSLGLGVNAGGAAANTSLAAAGNARANVGVLQNGYATAMQGMQSSAGILQGQYNSQLSAWNTQNQANGQAAQGVGAVVGTIGTIAAVY